MPLFVATAHPGCIMTSRGIIVFCMFTIRLFNDEWDVDNAPVVRCDEPMAKFVLTANEHEIVPAAAWLIKHNPHLDIEFDKGLNRQHADNFIRNRVSILVTAKEKLR